MVKKLTVIIYYICALDSNEIKTLFNLTSSIAEKHAENYNVTVYPNIFSHSAILEFDNTKKENFILTLYNTIGRQVRETNNIRTGKIIIEKKNLNSGLYFYSLQNSKGIIKSGKIIIQ